MYTPIEIERYTKILRQAGVPDDTISSMMDFVYTIASIAVYITASKSIKLKRHGKEQNIER